MNSDIYFIFNWDWTCTKRLSFLAKKLNYHYIFIFIQFVMFKLWLCRLFSLIRYIWNCNVYFSSIEYKQFLSVGYWYYLLVYFDWFVCSCYANAIHCLFIHAFVLCIIIGIWNNYVFPLLSLSSLCYFWEATKVEFLFRSISFELYSFNW